MRSSTLARALRVIEDELVADMVAGFEHAARVMVRDFATRAIATIKQSSIESLVGSVIDDEFDERSNDRRRGRRALPPKRLEAAVQGRLPKRSHAEIERMAESVERLVHKSETGLRAEEIRLMLRCDRRELPSVIRVLFSGKRIQKRGRGRSTVYFRPDSKNNVVKLEAAKR